MLICERENEQTCGYKPLWKAAWTSSLQEVKMKITSLTEN